MSPRRMMHSATATMLVASILALFTFGCESRSRDSVRYPPQQPPPGGQQYPPGQYPPGQAPPGQPPPGQPPPGQPPAPQPAPGAAAPPYASTADPINNVDIAWLRSRAQSVLTELLNALDPGPRSRVANIPLVVDDTVGSVNAFAACTADGQSAMAITDGLLDIMAHLAQFQATDETFGSAKADEYIRFVAANQRPDQPIVRPQPGFITGAQHADPRKLSRQHQLLDEELAFVLGHELAHHYLGHLPCTATGGALTGSEINAVLSSAIPAFNQGNEAASDVNGTNNVLNAGQRRQGYHWNEGGALLSMRFFAGLDQFSPIDIIFGFERSHPPPVIRQPIIQQTAAAWRAMGGRSIPIP